MYVSVVNPRGLVLVSLTCFKIVTKYDFSVCEIFGNISELLKMTIISAI